MNDVCAWCAKPAPQRPDDRAPFCSHACEVNWWHGRSAAGISEDCRAAREAFARRANPETRFNPSGPADSSVFAANICAGLRRMASSLEDTEQYRYRLSSTGHNSTSKYGPCEVCRTHVPEVYIQVESRRYELGYTLAGCRTLFGHRECLEGARR